MQHGILKTIEGIIHADGFSQWEIDHGEAAAGMDTEEGFVRASGLDS
jgi:hypothetical protein